MLNGLSNDLTTLHTKLSSNIERALRNKSREGDIIERSSTWKSIAEGLQVYVALTSEYISKSGILNPESYEGDEEQPESMMIQGRNVFSTQKATRVGVGAGIRSQTSSALPKLLSKLKIVFDSKKSVDKPGEQSTPTNQPKERKWTRKLGYMTAFIAWTIIRQAMQVPLMLLRGLIHGFVQSVLWAVIASTGYSSAYAVSKTLFVTSRALPALTEGAGIFLEFASKKFAKSFGEMGDELMKQHFAIDFMNSDWIKTIKNAMGIVRTYVKWVPLLIGSSAHFVASVNPILMRFIDREYDPGKNMLSSGTAPSVSLAYGSVLGEFVSMEHGGENATAPGFLKQTGDVISTAGSWVYWAGASVFKVLGATFGAVGTGGVAGVAGDVVEKSASAAVEYSAWTFLAQIEWSQIGIGYLLFSLVWYLSACITEFIMHYLERFVQYKRVVALQKYYLLKTIGKDPNYEEIKHNAWFDRPPIVYLANINWILITTTLTAIKSFLNLIPNAIKSIFGIGAAQNAANLARAGVGIKSAGVAVVAKVGQFAFDVMTGPTWGVHGWYKWSQTRNQQVAPNAPGGGRDETQNIMQVPRINNIGAGEPGYEALIEEPTNDAFLE